MVIQFNVGNHTATFVRSWFTGKATLTLDGQTRLLQNPLNPSTHFSVRPSLTWIVKTEGHDIVIEKKRPLLADGFRRQSYQIHVDGQVLAEEIGY